MRYFILAGFALVGVLCGIAGGIAACVADQPILVFFDVAIVVVNVSCMHINIAAGIRSRRMTTSVPVPINWGAVRCRPFTPVPGHPAALDRARELLLRLLTPEQRAEYLETSAITIKTNKGRYWLASGHRLVAELDGIERSLCIQFDPSHLLEWGGPHGLCPEEDRLIAILLMIRTDEAGLWKRSGFQQANYVHTFIVPGDWTDEQVRQYIAAMPSYAAPGRTLMAPRCG